MGESREQAIEWDLHETTEIAPLEFTEELKPELYGLELSEATNLVGGIDVIKHELEVLKNAYIDVIKLEITAENLPTFKDLRKNFTKNRTSAERLRTAKKAYFLNGGRFVDAIFKDINAQRELMESKLLEAEKFFENQEKEKARLINLERIEKISPYVESVDNLDFSDFDDESFDDYVLGKKTRFENEVKAKIEAELLAEAERLSEIERQKAIEVENAKLKAEAELKEIALQKERAEAKAKQEAIELKAKQEREQAEEERQIEADKQAEIQAEKDAEIKRLNNEQTRKDDEEIEVLRLRSEEREKLAKAPIKKQLTVWVESFDLPSNQMLNNDVANEITFKFEAFKKWALTQVNNL
jgi:colicin import membrane protein